MRIIAGIARRTELEVAEDSSTRPFLEMARGALFNSLGASVVDADALDLYAGSGALGLEALSRGAARAVFVERDPLAVAALKKNILRCGMADRCRIVRGDVGRMVAESAESFDLIFVDPPFPELAAWRRGGGADALMADAAKRLKADGVLVFRLEDGKVSPPEWPGLSLESEKRYGRSRVCRYVPAARAVADAEEKAAT
jgi:16S rRNA (guanine(966)-N(2))-methyltransferase RsmD